MLMDQGNLNGPETLTTLAAEPILSAALLRQASSASSGQSRQVSSIVNALMVLGCKGAKAAAQTMLLREFTASRSASKTFQADRFVSHSTYVAFMAKCLFDVGRARGNSNSELTPDEVFTLGVVHELPLASLAFVRPDVFDNVYLHAVENRTVLASSFRALYSSPIDVLVEASLERWELPTKFSSLICEAASDEPGQDLDFAVQCLRIADQLAIEDRYPVVAQKRVQGKDEVFEFNTFCSPEELDNLRQSVQAWTVQTMMQVRAA